jgi:DNA topoisomerase I
MSEEQIKCPSKLKYVSDREPGIKRVKKGKGFCYYTPEGKLLENDKIKARIDSLAIPPIWKNVWICKNHNGHLQVTGIDLKGRKQYLYHPEWVAYRQGFKYEKMLSFGKALSKIRKQINKDLQREEWDKQKVTALTLKILDKHYIRIGKKYYTEQNNSYGLTTLRRKHLIKDGKTLRFEYRAKSGKDRQVTIEDLELKTMIQETSELPGYEIFRYKDEKGKSQPILSEDINDYLREISGQDFTAKDFRTWAGTVISLKKIKEARDMVKENPRLNLDATLVKLVAIELGNTPETCREYYIHPKVFAFVLEQKLPSKRPTKWHSKEENMVMHILQNT